MPLDARLLEILACPDDKGPLYYFAPAASEKHGGFLLCPACRRRYEIRDDIPVMLIDEAAVLAASDAEAVMARAAELGLQPTFTP